MNPAGYGEYIVKQIQSWPVDKHITTIEVAEKLVNAFDVKTEQAKKITNVKLKRLADSGELVRVGKGIYGKTKNTPFGKLQPCTNEILIELLLKERGRTIGYIAGPTLLNALGLCSLMPNERYIKTNNFRRKLPVNAAIRVQRPTTTVTDENVTYLRTMEAFDAIEHYPVDAEQPETILRGMLKTNNIDNEKLIWYARNFYNNRTLLKTIDIALGGLR